MADEHRPLRASEPRPHALPLHEKPADPDHEREVILVVRGPDGDAAHVQGMGIAPPHARRYLTPARYEADFGASSKDLDAAERFALRHGLEVISKSSLHRSVVARGALKALEKAFRVDFLHYFFSTGYHLSHRGPVHLPASHHGLIEAVLGLSDLPIAEPHLHARHHPAVPHVEATDVAKHYEFPEGATGRGRTVAVIELGGGYHPTDIEEYFRSCGSRARVEVACGENLPADVEVLDQVLTAMGLAMEKAPPPPDVPHADRRAARNSMSNLQWTLETTTDIELIGAFAPEADIRVYFGSNTMLGKFRALCAALDDNPDVISMSFGGWESRKAPHEIEVFERLFRRAALQGITVVTSSGDDGQLQYPASSPYVLACGGTHLHDSQGRLVSEEAWSEDAVGAAGRRLCSGGGVSDFFALPAWQESAQVQIKTGLKGRGVPDVSAKADLMTGYRTTVGSLPVRMGGTSSAAPLWAGLVACLNQDLGYRLGWITPLLYSDPALRKALRSVDVGNAGMYRACADWDPVTGLGSPHGRRLLEWFRGLVAS